ncbi:MAG: glycosyltransferase family 39 protein [Planctomycetes bacterium]|nr:glycosyltransferase family 39 protein [Planctomycetota bacterium]MBI3844752.1 glycosyltransferase family 39 protein [Planctomycetota bacterium]
MIELAARNLDTYGFANLRFGVTMDDGPALGLEPYYYVPWPSFPTVALAVLFKLGCSPRVARIFPLLIASSTLIAVFLLVRRVVGSTPAAFAALLALAVQAPFRLLSDSFCYQSYDFAAKAWTILFVTLACTSDGRTRRRFLAAAAATSFGAMFLCGFEMIPAIAIYAVLAPLVIAPGNRRDRARLAAWAGAAVTAGLVVALAGRVAHNAVLLGSLGAAIGDLATAAAVRVSTDFPRLLGWGFRWEMFVRMRDYHWLSLIVFAASSILVIALARRRVLLRRRIVWLGVIALGESAWYLVFRHHT